MPLPLPIEIVEYILDLACAFPDLSAHLSPPYSYSLYSTDHGLPLSAVKLSASSLFSLALVCKQWNAICTPRLYRHLAIVNDTAIHALLRTLEQSQITATVSGSIKHLGSLTRHLIIALSDSADNEFEHLERRIERRFGNLGRLARCLTHLEIISISILIQGMWGLPRPYYGKDFAATATRTCAPSLLKLHLHHDGGALVLFSRPELRKFLESSPNLIAITGAGVGDCIGCPVTLPYLPKLKYLAVNSKIGRCNHIGLEDDRTPLLDHIHIRLGFLSNDWLHLLSVQGARLASVSLDLRLSQIHKNFSEYLSQFTKFCPNLSYLEICVDNWVSFPQLESLPPVERLGIHVQACNTSVDTICETLATIQSSSLKAVQLMSPGIFDQLTSSDNVKSAWSPLVDRAFRVVDRYGRNLPPE